MSQLYDLLGSNLKEQSAPRCDALSVREEPKSASCHLVGASLSPLALKAGKPFHTQIMKRWCYSPEPLNEKPVKKLVNLFASWETPRNLHAQAR